MNWQDWHCMSSACKKQPEKRRIWATQHGKMGQNDWLQVPKTSKNQIRLTITKLTMIIQECEEKSERVAAYLDISEIWLTINGIQDIVGVSIKSCFLHVANNFRNISCLNHQLYKFKFFGVAIINSTILSTSPFTMFAHSPNATRRILVSLGPCWSPSSHC